MWFLIGAGLGYLHRIAHPEQPRSNDERMWAWATALFTVPVLSIFAWAFLTIYLGRLAYVVVAIPAVLMELRCIAFLLGPRQP